jgi:hypothetical protein
LSGGLGGSQYVKSKVQEHYVANPHPNAPNITNLKSQKPRLAVAKGLVMDRRQRIVTGASALKTRMSVPQNTERPSVLSKGNSARASYGVLCRQLYNPTLHVGADIQIDQFNKNQKWVIM